MTAPLIAAREALAESICRSFHALHFAQMPGACPSCNRLTDALLASDAIQTPAEFAAGLAEDEALLTEICQRQGLSESDGWIWEERGVMVASAFRDAAAALAERPTS